LSASFEAAVDRMAEAAVVEVRPWMAVVELSKPRHVRQREACGGAAIMDDRKSKPKTGILRDDDARRATLIPRIKWAGWPDFQAFRTRRTCTRIR